MASSPPPRRSWWTPKTESELAGLPADEAAEWLAGIGQDERPKEASACAIPAGATALQAAGVIHSDVQRGFIKAEIVPFDQLVEAGPKPRAGCAGTTRRCCRSRLAPPHAGCAPTRW